MLELIVDGRTRGHDGWPPYEGLGMGAAGLNTIFSLSDAVVRCTPTEPEPPDGDEPNPVPTQDKSAGRGVRVVIVDTGLDLAATQRYEWMSGVTGDDDPGVRTNPIELYAGHGTFIAGVLRCMAPCAEVFVKRAFVEGGALAEIELVKALDEVLQSLRPDIISLSAGSRTFRNADPLGLAVFNETRLRHHKGVVLIAAAGNDDSRITFWPAAAGFAVSIGALNADLNDRASFSNYGGWVDVYAPGADLVNAYATGVYKYLHDPSRPSATFTGLAKWSGTSFATPIVAGLIAARMSHTGENGRDAASALIRIAQSAAQPGVGAVLLPK
jgi:subtilisin family serine protease